LHFGGGGDVGDNADGAALAMRAGEFGDEFVDTRFIGGDVVYGDGVAFLGEAADDGFASGGKMGQ